MGTILVTGATGMLGRAVVPELVRNGMPVRATSRNQREPQEGITWVVADFTTGVGISTALDGVDTVIHLAAAPYKGSYTDRVEVEGTRRLLQTTAAHIIYVSIVGIDKVPWGYFRTKLRTEALLEGANASIIRATQFFPFVDRALRYMAKSGVMVIDPGIQAQPVDVGDVAQRIRQQVDSGPSGRIDEFGGPEILTPEKAARQWLHANGKRRPILKVKVPGTLGRAFREGALTTEAAPTGTKTWREYLG